MKKLNPEQIKKDLGSAKKVSYTPAGAKGLDKLKLMVCRGLRKTAEATAGMFKDQDQADQVAPLFGLGVCGLGFGAISGAMGHPIPTSILTASAAMTSLIAVGPVAEKAEKGLRNLEASILKRIRKNEANPLITAKAMEHAHAR